MKKLMLVLALLILGSFMSQGAFAGTPTITYPACYQGYANGSSKYNGTNKDRWDVRGWCVDDYGVFTPQTGLSTNSNYPNSQGGIAYPIVNNNYSTTLYRAANPSTYDALYAQQTGSVIVDYGAEPLSPTTIDTLSGTGGHYVLPAAFPGEEFTITSASKSVITVDVLRPGFANAVNAINGTYPNASMDGMTAPDIIEFSPGGVGMTAGQNLQSQGYAGDGITLTAVSQGIWMITSFTSGNAASMDATWLVTSNQ